MNKDQTHENTTSGTTPLDSGIENDEFGSWMLTKRFQRWKKFIASKYQAPERSNGKPPISHNQKGNIPLNRKDPHIMGSCFSNLAELGDQFPHKNHSNNSNEGSTSGTKTVQYCALANPTNRGQTAISKQGKNSQTWKAKSAPIFTAKQSTINAMSHVLSNANIFPAGTEGMPQHPRPTIHQVSKTSIPASLSAQVPNTGQPNKQIVRKSTHCACPCSRRIFGA